MIGSRSIGNLVPAAVLGIILLGCAPAPVLPPAPPLSPQEIIRILDKLDHQEKQVHSVFSLGKVKFRDGESSSELDTVMIAIREPLRIKLELIHSWGRPVSHVLVRDGRLQILSIPEKRLYAGSLEDRSFSRFLPAGLGSKQFWALTRSYPVIVDHCRQVSTRSDEIRLLDAEGRTVEMIHLDPATALVRRISFPRQGIQIHYSDYAHQDGIPFAREMEIHETGSETHFLLRVKQIEFNQSVPGELFLIDVPPDYETSPL